MGEVACLCLGGFRVFGCLRDVNIESRAWRIGPVAARAEGYCDLFVYNLGWQAGRAHAAGEQAREKRNAVDTAVRVVGH